MHQISWNITGVVHGDEAQLTCPATINGRFSGEFKAKPVYHSPEFTSNTCDGFDVSSQGLCVCTFWFGDVRPYVLPRSQYSQSLVQ
jgi:hypothetical protein